MKHARDQINEIASPDEPLSAKVDSGSQRESQPATEGAGQRFLPLTALALGSIRFYQRFISPGLPASCRFEPTCSRYTYGAIERFGLGRGLLLGAARICRCHPLCEGGFDPVPERFSLRRQRPSESTEPEPASPAS